MVPVEVIYGGRAYQDEVDITAKEVYALLKEGKTLTTSVPSPERFLQAFHQLEERTKEILCLSLSSKYSAAFTSVQLAIEVARRESPQLKIELVDCHTSMVSQALATLAAAKAVASGKSMAEVVTEVQKITPQIEMLVLLDTLEHLRRGGRVPGIAAWASSLLKIKPVVSQRLDEVHLVGMVRSRSRGMERVMRELREKVRGKRIEAVLAYGDMEEEASLLKDWISSGCDCGEFYIREVLPSVAVHAGPLLAVAFYAAD